MNKPNDDRLIMMSGPGFEDLTKPEGGRNLHWTVDKNSEIPIKLRQNGVGSETPQTMLELFWETKEKYKSSPCMFVQRNK